MTLALLMLRRFHQQKIPQRSVPDRIVWHEAFDGIYSAKLGYHFWQKTQGSNHNIVQSGGWKKLWALNIPHKIKVFLWRFCRNNIPVRNRLAGKGLHIEIGCPLCNTHVEHLLHIFFDCQFATRCWQYIGLHYNMWIVEDAPLWLLEKLNSETNGSLVQIAATLWGIWHFRNKKVWENKVVTAELAIEWSMRNIEGWQAACKTSSRNRDRGAIIVDPRVHRWKPPRPREFKINVDASVVPGTNSFSIGMVIRDHEGSFIRGKCMRFTGEISVFGGEVIGVDEALSWIDFLDMHHVAVDSDSLLTVNALDKKSNNFLEVGHILESCKAKLMSRSDVRVCFVKRQANKVAHVMARTPCMLDSHNVYISPHCEFIGDTFV